MAGDYNGNGIINRNDYNVYNAQTGQSNQYSVADGNLNRSVGTDDFGVLRPNMKQVGVVLIRY